MLCVCTWAPQALALCKRTLACRCMRICLLNPLHVCSRNREPVPSPPAATQLATTGSRAPSPHLPLQGLQFEVLRYTVTLFAAVLAAAGIKALRHPTGEEAHGCLLLCSWMRRFARRRIQQLQYRRAPPHRRKSLHTLLFGASTCAGLKQCAALPPPLARTAARHVYSMLTGLGLLYYAFGAGMLHALIPTALTYVAMALAPKRCGALSWGINMAYLLYV